jgi:hypothetical protein
MRKNKVLFVVGKEDVEGVFVLQVADAEDDVGDIIRQLIMRMNQPIDQFTFFMRFQGSKIGIRLYCEIGGFGQCR